MATFPELFDVFRAFFNLWKALIRLVRDTGLKELFKLGCTEIAQEKGTFSWQHFLIYKSFKP